MSEPKDIVGKADAFLGRFRSAQEPPVLTDVVDVAGAGSAPNAAPAPSDAELLALERQVTQQVLDAIQPAISRLLDQAVGAFRQQCKAQVDAIVREAVAKSVEREIQQLRQAPPTGR